MSPEAILDLSEQVEMEGLDLGIDPYPLYVQLRGKGPVHRVRRPVTKDVCRLIVDPEEASAARAGHRLSNGVRLSASWKGDGSLAIGRNMLQVDAAHHARVAQACRQRIHQPGAVPVLCHPADH